MPQQIKTGYRYLSGLLFVLSLFLTHICLGGVWEIPVDVTNDIYGHTATVLPNGNVLLAGGWGRKEAYYTAWLYEPETGTFRRTDNLIIPRAGHTATLLPTGKVLILGGKGSKEAQSVIELYEPGEEREQGTFKTCGTLLYPRLGHTATLLLDGTVLIAGGGQSQAESFDPITQTCNRTAKLIGNPAHLTATLLPNGQVLLIEGESRLAQIYDPMKKTFSATGSLQFARSGHTAALLPSGLVLVTGGGPKKAELYDFQQRKFRVHTTWKQLLARQTSTLLPDGTLLGLGGEGKGPDAKAWLYTPASGTFKTAPAMHAARVGHTATLLPSGEVFVFGGGLGVRPEVYQPTTGAFHPVGGMDQKRNTHTATLLPTGEVLVAGGYNGAYLESCELFDPAQNKFIRTGNLAVPRHCHSATLLPDGKVLVAGGYGSGTYWSSAELYEFKTRTFALTGSLCLNREKHSATLLPNGDVLVVGGFNGAHLKNAELYSVVGRQFIPVGSMDQAREKHAATLLKNGLVLITGGYDGKHILKSAELYDPQTRKFQLTGKLCLPRRIHTATLLASGKVLIAGGINTKGCVRQAELYDPTTGMFSKTGELRHERSSHTATLLPNGNVLIAGGGAQATELYHPETGTFARASELNGRRREHSATLLTTGEVLVIGGENGPDYLNTAERGQSIEYRDAGAGHSLMPIIQNVTDDVSPGMPCVLKGSRFWGATSEHFPRVYIQMLDSGSMSAYGSSGYRLDLTLLLYPLKMDSMDSTLSFKMPDVLPGYWLVMVDNQGCLSEAKVIRNKHSTVVPGMAVPKSRPTGTPTVTPSTTAGWQEEFEGVPGKQPVQWMDERQDPDFNAEINGSYQSGGYACMTRTADSSWGRIKSELIRCDVSCYNMIEAKVIAVSPGIKWNIAIREKGTDYYWDLVGGSSDLGTRSVDFQQQTGWKGVKEFYIQINLEAEEGKYILLDFIRVYGYTKK